MRHLAIKGLYWSSCLVSARRCMLSIERAAAEGEAQGDAGRRIEQQEATEQRIRQFKQRNKKTTQQHTTHTEATQHTRKHTEAAGPPKRGGGGWRGAGG